MNNFNPVFQNTLVREYFNPVFQNTLEQARLPSMTFGKCLHMAFKHVSIKTLLRLSYQ